MKSFDIRQTAYDKIIHWVDKAEGEVSGLGTVIFKDGVATVEDVMLLDQENTGASTDIDAVAICKALTQFVRSGKEGEVNFWWHSHVNMGVFWSQTDLDTIEELSENGWFLHTVFNKKRETRSCYSENVKLTSGETFLAMSDDIDMFVIDDIETETTKKDKIANEAYSKYTKLHEANEKKKEKLLEKIEELDDAVLYLKDEYEQLKEEALEEKTDAWDKEYDEKAKTKTYKSSFPNGSKYDWSQSEFDWEDYWLSDDEEGDVFIGDEEDYEGYNLPEKGNQYYTDPRLKKGLIKCIINNKTTWYNPVTGEYLDD